MSERKRLFLLISIMTAASLIVAGITMFILYRAAFSEEKDTARGERPRVRRV